MSTVPSIKLFSIVLASKNQKETWFYVNAALCGIIKNALNSMEMNKILFVSFAGLSMISSDVLSMSYVAVVVNMN